MKRTLSINAAVIVVGLQLQSARAIELGLHGVKASLELGVVGGFGFDDLQRSSNAVWKPASAL